MIRNFYQMNLTVYLVLLAFVVSVCCDYQLKHVQLLYRHGDRAPSSIYPKDINQENRWPNGIGQLTDIGISQQFRLGLWLRQRYSSLIGPLLQNSDIHVRSTDYDRTLMSSEANLAGFVFNESHHVIPGLPWRPVAIHTVREKSDYLLEYDSCPQYMIQKIALYEREYFKKKFAPYAFLLPKIKESTGRYDLSFVNLWNIYDTLFCEKSNNMTVNDWVTNKMWDDLLKINKVNWELMFYENLSKLTGGLLLYTINKRMLSISQNQVQSKDGSKIIMYSGHDTDVAPLSKLLGFYDNMQPSYASCIIIELYSNPNITNQWAVKVLYKNETDSTDLHVKVVPGCRSVLCPLSQFLEVTKSKTLSKEEYLKECAVTIGIFIYVEIVFISVCAGLFLFIIVMFCIRYNRKKGVKYSRFDSGKSIH